MDMGIFDKPAAKRAPGRKRVSPNVAKEFNGGYDASTFRSAEHPAYRMASVIQCRRCAAAMPCGLSPREFQFLEVGVTAEALQVWCKRCESEVFSLDFGGAAMRRVAGHAFTLADDAAGAPFAHECQCDACAARRALLDGPAAGNA